MNFARSLMGTILVAIVGAVLLAGIPAGTAQTMSRNFLGAASADTFAIVFFALAGTLIAALVAMILLEEKPLADTHLD
jgi:hypothetical protein